VVEEEINRVFEVFSFLVEKEVWDEQISKGIYIWAE
jgi:hypothetical protein